jgi:hypothetical protein
MSWTDEGDLALEAIVAQVQTADLKRGDEAALKDRAARAEIRKGLGLPGVTLSELFKPEEVAAGSEEGVDRLGPGTEGDARRREALAANVRALNAGRFPPPPTFGGRK